ncbi:MAG: hypothetical protein AAFY48_21335 [Bacteroidota bacterium]
MHYKNDKVWIGLLAGVLIPFVGYAILLMILEQLAANEALANQRLNFDFRTRTIGLLALALNLIPMRFFRKRRANQAIRGLVLATMAYGLVWVYFFGQQLLGS